MSPDGSALATAMSRAATPVFESPLGRRPSSDLAPPSAPTTATAVLSVRASPLCPPSDTGDAVSAAATPGLLVGDTVASFDRAWTSFLTSCGVGEHRHAHLAITSRKG